MRRYWWVILATLAAVRVAIPLADWATSVPALPRFHYRGLQGDANGFYDATREFIAAWGRVPRAGLVLLALAAVACAIVLVRAWRRRPAERPWLLAAGVLAFGLVVCVDVAEQHPSGAAVFGWPLVWALPMLPYRALGGHLDHDVAYGFGLALSLAAVAGTVVATAYAGLHATGRRSLGLLAAAFFTAWPFLSGAIAGHRAWANDQWNVEGGLHMYTEPLSTALVAGGLAIVLAPRLTPMRMSVAGVLLSLASCVKLSNALLTALALAVVVWRDGARRALPFVAGALSLAPVALVYWPLSYPKLFGNPHSWPRDPFDPAHVVTAWTHSSVFTPHTLAILVPLAAIGAFGVRRPYALALVVGWLLINPVFYSFYANTPKHPRFLYASLPALFVLWAAGIGVLAALVPQLRTRAAPRTLTP